MAAISIHVYVERLLKSSSLGLMDQFEQNLYVHVASGTFARYSLYTFVDHEAGLFYSHYKFGHKYFLKFKC